MIITEEWLEKKARNSDIYKWLKEYSGDMSDIRNITIDMIKDKGFGYAVDFIIHLLTPKKRMKYCIYAAEQTLHIFNKRYPYDPIMKNIIEITKDCFENKTEENISKLKQILLTLRVEMYRFIRNAQIENNGEAVIAINVAKNAAFILLKKNVFGEVTFSKFGHAHYSVWNAIHLDDPKINKNIINYGMKLLGKENIYDNS